MSVESDVAHILYVGDSEGQVRKCRSKCCTYRKYFRDSVDYVVLVLVPVSELTQLFCLSRVCSRFDSDHLAVQGPVLELTYKCELFYYFFSSWIQVSFLGALF